MTATLLDLLAEARRVGITLDRDGDRLTIRAPRTAAALARALLARKHDVFEALDAYSHRVVVLDWRGASWTAPAPCRACSAPTRLRDPYDHHPWHKTCAERRLAEPVVPSMAHSQPAATRPGNTTKSTEG